MQETQIHIETQPNHVPLIPKGYKQTELGLIPEEWKIIEFKEALINGSLPSGLYKDKALYGQGSPIIKLGDVFRYDYFIPSKVQRVELKSSEFSSHGVQEGDLILALASVKLEGVGKVMLVTKLDEPTVYDHNVALIRLSDKYDSFFISYLLKSKNVRLQVSHSATQVGTTFLKASSIKKFKLPIPATILEQKAIAQVLSDTDNLLQALEQKIAKKRAIKQGAMQRLLTPQENWKKTCLVELADNKKSQFDDGDWVESEYIISQGVRLIQTGNIGIGQFKDKGNKKYISEDSFNKLNCKEVLVGDLLICRLAEPAGRGCIMPNIGEYKVITSVDVSIFRGNLEAVNREFLSQLFTTNNWFQKVIEKVGGTTHKRISRGALGKIEILIPLIEEQKAIAQILSDMDTEITQLETKKEKYQAIKQGMMQELLTGKIRLV